MTRAPLAHVATVSHVAIEVADLATSITFYQRTIGLTVAVDQRDETPPQIKGLVGDFVIEIAQIPAAQVTPDHAAMHRPTLCLSLATPDAIGAFTRLRAAGFVLQDEPGRRGGATFFSFRDPDGHLIELPDGAPSLSRQVADRLAATKKVAAS